uniref:Uncharacterized protein n=1 Tax=Strigamia maritima TaxID=126957 RepID=T1IKU5_STRMM
MKIKVSVPDVSVSRPRYEPNLVITLSGKCPGGGSCKSGAAVNSSTTRSSVFKIFYLKRINKSGLTRYTTEVNYLSIIIVYVCFFFLKNLAVAASRLFEVVEKDKFDQEIPVEWETWLRERRKDVCIDKIRKNNAIQQNAIRKAKELEELEEQDAAKRPMNIEPKREPEKKSFPEYKDYEER